MTGSNRPLSAGRGSQINPPNRFVRIEVEDDFEHLEHDADFQHERQTVRTEYFSDPDETPDRQVSRWGSATRLNSLEALRQTQPGKGDPRTAIHDPRTGLRCDG